MSDYLLEVGTEEIPARFIEGGLDYLSEALSAALTVARIDHGDIDTFGTPRRLAAICRNIATTQRDKDELIVGPPARIAFDEDGKPTKAALGFAKKNGLDPAALTKGEVAGKKGEYLLCQAHEKGLPTREVLGALVAGVLDKWPWPKSMRWGAGEAQFVRPVQWLVSVLDGDIVPFSFAGLTAGDKTRGHRFLAPDEIAVTPADYELTLEKVRVVASIEKRANGAAAAIETLAKKNNVQVRPDPELAREVACLIETPIPVLGSFDESFLEVPPEVIISAMRSHQRYFACEKNGALTNAFITVANTEAKDMDVVKEGNEKVLVARLSDAKFFYDVDRKTGLEAMAKDVAAVLYHKKIGTMGERISRITALAKWVAANTGVTGPTEAAAKLCKADLASKMVYEFPDLQGVMGEYYARAEGLDEAVAVAIREHYQPRFADDDLPETPLGVVLAVADRIDLVVCGFVGNMKPTGSSDPFGVRRAAIGLLGLLADSDLDVNALLAVAAGQAASIGKNGAAADEVAAEVKQFLLQRLRGVLAQYAPADQVEAVLAAPLTSIADARARVRALSSFAATEEFLAVAAGFKRIANIVKGHEAQPPNKTKFTEVAEKALWQEYQGVAAAANAALENGDYGSALSAMAQLRAAVDTFFDGVLVMCDDDSVKHNRIAMLATIRDTFAGIADFRQIEVEA